MDEKLPPQTVKDKLIIFYYNLIPLVSLNIVWLLLTLPIITAIPALGALYYATNVLVHENSADWGVFWEGFKKYFWISYKWGLVSLAVLGLILLNIRFYGQFESIWAAIAQVLFLWIALLYFFLQLYTFPMIVEQKQKKLRIAVRNALVIFLSRPWKSIVLLVGSTLILTVSVVITPFLFVISMSLVTFWCNKSTIEAIKKLPRADKKPSEEINANVVDVTTPKDNENGKPGENEETDSTQVEQ